MAACAIPGRRTPAFETLTGTPPCAPPGRGPPTRGLATIGPTGPRRDTTAARRLPGIPWLTVPVPPTGGTPCGSTAFPLVSSFATATAGSLIPADPRLLSASTTLAAFLPVRTSPKAPLSATPTLGALVPASPLLAPTLTPATNRPALARLRIAFCRTSAIRPPGGAVTPPRLAVLAWTRISAIASLRTGASNRAAVPALTPPRLAGSPREALPAVTPPRLAAASWTALTAVTPPGLAVSACATLGAVTPPRLATASWTTLTAVTPARLAVSACATLGAPTPPGLASPAWATFAAVIPAWLGVSGRTTVSAAVPPWLAVAPGTAVPALAPELAVSA
ncbi:MAG TPA: hypothetical protein VGS19_12075 [Streptosporangiaceae bacterium]|nr:hypothetical protein [Streptosporangiaceae bacterium]